MRHERPHFRSRDCYLTPADKDALYEIIRERYPTTICGRFDRRNHRLNRYSKLSEATDNCNILIPDEPDWKDEWIHELSPFGTQTLVLGNLPSRCLSYYPTGIKHFKVSDFADHDLPNRPLDDEIIRINGHSEFQGSFYDDEPDTKEMMTWVFNVMRRLWTNRYQVIDLETDKVIDEYAGSYEWCGPDALRRCTEEPNFFTVVWNDPRYETLIGIKALPKMPRARKRPGAGKPAATG